MVAENGPFTPMQIFHLKSAITSCNSHYNIYHVHTICLHCTHDMSDSFEVIWIV